jgi:phage baseplate assembly protein W
MYGRDLWFDVATPEGADTIVGPSGDWKLVEGREALRQALLRRILTNPGEWATLPDYGVGARLYVKAKYTRAMRDELTARISSQLMRDPRVERVEQVVVDQPEAGLLKITVQVTPKGRLLRDGPLVATVEVA